MLFALCWWMFAAFTPCLLPQLMSKALGVPSVEASYVDVMLTTRAKDCGLPPVIGMCEVAQVGVMLLCRLAARPHHLSQHVYCSYGNRRRTFPANSCSTAWMRSCLAASASTHACSETDWCTSATRCVPALTSPHSATCCVRPHPHHTLNATHALRRR